MLRHQVSTGDMYRSTVKEQTEGKLNKVSKLSVKVKFNDFVSTTADFSCNQLDDAIFTSLFEKAYSRGGNKGVRLLGIGVGLGETQLEHEQLAMFET